MTPRLAAHQDQAVDELRRILDTRGGALYADEVGMGKSWVAAALAREWQKRGRRSLFLVPAPLIEQWRELLGLFFVDAEVRSHESLLTRELPSEPALVVVDEAHRFRNPATKRYRALALAVIGRTVLLVTATPFVNRSDDVHALLRLFTGDDALQDCGVASIAEAFASASAPELRRIVGSLTVRRVCEILPVELRFGELVRTTIASPHPVNHDAICEAITQLRFPLLAHSGGRGTLQAFLLRRLASSEAALRATLRRQRRFYRRAREALLEGSRVSKQDILGVFGRDDEDQPFQDLLFKPLWFGANDGSSAEFEEIDRELALVDRLLSLIAGTESPKLDSLLNVLTETDVLPALVFTGSVATAKELFKRCTATHRCGLVTSRYSSTRVPATAGTVFGAFSRGDLDVLIATDVGAEGLNLQRAASVVHFDLPWNPVRLDQRNGRSLRIGQTRQSVRSIVFVPPEGRRDFVAATLLRKDIRRRSLLAAVRERPAGGAPSTLPSLVAHASARRIWRTAVAESGFLGAEWEELLGASYPAGVDIWLSENAARATELVDLGLSLLRNARRTSPRGGAS